MGLDLHYKKCTISTLFILEKKLFFYVLYLQQSCNICVFQPKKHKKKLLYNCISGRHFNLFFLHNMNTGWDKCYFFTHNMNTGQDKYYFFTSNVNTGQDKMLFFLVMLWDMRVWRNCDSMEDWRIYRQSLTGEENAGWFDRVTWKIISVPIYQEPWGQIFVEKHGLLYQLSMIRSIMCSDEPWCEHVDEHVGVDRVSNFDIFPRLWYEWHMLHDFQNLNWG